LIRRCLVSGFLAVTIHSRINRFEDGGKFSKFSARWGERDRPRPEMVDLLQAAVIRRRKAELAHIGAELAGRYTNGH
jgi:hypothetical protein